jgi:hypothetical protein
MPALEADPQWSMPCIGYHIQARPDQSSVSRLISLQRQIESSSRIALRVIPPGSLHLSVVTLIRAQPPSAIAEQQWMTISRSLDSELVTLARHAEPLSIVLTGVAYTARAVIAFTEQQPDYLIEARSRFGDLLQSLGLAHSVYDRTHITIARYAENALLEGETTPQQIHLEVQLASIGPVCERRYPSLEIEQL